MLGGGGVWWGGMLGNLNQKEFGRDTGRLKALSFTSGSPDLDNRPAVPSMPHTHQCRSQHVDSPLSCHDDLTFVATMPIR